MPDVEASELFEDPFIEEELRALVKDLAVSKSEFIRLMAAFSPSDRRENIRRAWSRTSVHSSLEGSPDIPRATLASLAIFFASKNRMPSF